MRSAATALHLALVVVGAFASTALVGCGRSPAYPQRAVRVVPADQVKGTCACNDGDAQYDGDDGDVVDDEDAPRPSPAARGVAYVKMREWRAPASVQDFEATNPSRGEQPQVYTRFPDLTLHQSIDQSTYRSWRWTQAHAQ